MPRKLSKSKVFLYLSLSFILGIAIGSYISPPFFSLFLLALSFLTLAVWGWKNSFVRTAALGGIFLILGIVRFSTTLPQMNENRIEYYNGRTVTFIGMVIKEPDIRLDKIKLTTRSVVILRSPKGVEGSRVKGNILVTTLLYPEYHWGDRLKIKCELKSPPHLEDFDWEKYLVGKDIYSVCYYPEIILLEKGQGNIIKKQILSLKNSFTKALKKSLPEPQASLLIALLTGLRGSLSENLREALSKTGTSHIIAISGMHLTIIAGYIASLRKILYLPRKKAFWLSSLVILFFVLFTGAPASMIRAAILAILVLLAFQVGRLSKPSRALVLAGAGMLLFNPKLLRFDLGFQLSFLATLGLIYLVPFFENYFPNLTKIKVVRAYLWPSLGAYLFTLPLILYRFGYLSLVAPLANLLILPILPPVMAIGFAVGLSGLISPFLGEILGWFEWFFLSYVIYLIKWLAQIKYAAIKLNPPHPLVIILLYGLMIWWIWREQLKIKNAK